MINSVTLSYGFKQSEADPCIFVRDAYTDDWMLLSLYVDDSLIACKEVLDTFVSLLVSEFEITCHEPTCYVGMEITRDRTRGTLCINQQGYISQVSF